MQSAIRLLFVLAVLAFVPALSACDTYAVDDETVADNPPPPLVDTPPPPTAPYEAAPLLNDPQTELWRPGYWAMLNHQFVWVPGMVIVRPSRTAVWHNAYWMKHEYGWSFQMGHWE